MTYRFPFAATLAASLFVPTIAFAQPYERAPSPEPDVEMEVDSPSFAMLFDPITPLVSAAFGMVAVRAEVEVRLNDYAALDLRPAYVHYIPGGFWGDADANGGGGSVGVRIAPMGTGLTGFYVTPMVFAVHAYAATEEEEIDTTQVGPMVELGYTWAFGNFMLNAGGGVGYAFTVDGEDIHEDSPIGGLQLGGNFGIGFGI